MSASATDRTPGLPGGPERVAATRRVLPAVGSPVLDRVVGLASRLLGAPSSQISLLEDVQVVGAGHGPGPDPAGTRSPLADSLCTVTAAAGAPVVVTDAAQDDRVADLPPVTGGAVGAYLGVPLRGQQGHVVGALCVFDPAPRPWRDEDVALLDELAGYAATELELAALAAEYEADRTRWQLAVRAGGVGTFDWDLVTGALEWDDQLLDIFGLERGQFGRTIEDFVAALHPDDRPRVQEALRVAIEACDEYDAEYRVMLPRGGTRWVHARGRAVAGEDGTAVRLLGSAYDTTARRDADARVARVLETMSGGFYSLDEEWRFGYVNAEAEKLLGRSREELLGQSLWTAFPATVGSVFEEQYKAAVLTGTPGTFEAYYPPPLDGWYEVRAWPTDEGLSVHFHEITARHAAQAAAAEAGRVADEARRVAEDAQGAAERAARRLSLVAAVSADLTGTLDTDEAVARLAQHLVPALGSWCLVTLLDEHGTLRDVGSWHADPDARPLVQQYRRLRLPSLDQHSYLHRALREHRLVSVPVDATEHIAPLLAGPAQDALRALGPSAAYFLPLQARGRVVGIVSLFRGPDEGELSAGDLLTAAEVADRAGLAIDNARLYQQQHRIAESLQRSLLSAPVEPDHVEIVVRYLPAAEAAQVGGDWYDAFLQPDGATVLVIGDVMGHDSDAAAAMSQVRTLLRGIAYATGQAPAGVLTGLDAAMRGLEVRTLATAVVARLEQSEDERERSVTRLRWSNAGHLPPLLLHEDGTVTELHGNGSSLLLGIDPGVDRTDSVVTVDRGTTLLLYTDGLVERRDASLSDGIRRLRETVAATATDGLRGATLDELVDGVVARMVPERPTDDVALLAVRLHRQDRPRPADAPPARVPDAPPVPGA
ncbi:SpoIIE family protein phosphatase [Cellulomonas marina]|uniref:PAS domain S-box-containing protein n=1 Tax=Cellulomonas marina TaxID=988821 RepID=A0A1I0Y2D8_9CELL|nr:SpoIIE family protein phosphatase [Cellulomonas marina]GIG28417.1 hypothetical protein Cma02nite_10170 [Cellulomonas marina]SFB06780.1 PAS domain S-box-containing protein [Cellulomonas marina]